MPGARFFNNTTADFINRADDSTHDVGATDSMACAAWVRLEAVAAQSRFFFSKSAGGGPNTGWRLFMDASEFLSFQCADGTDGSQALDTVAIAAGTWVHALGVLDRGGNLTYIFKDGVQRDTTSASLVGSIATTSPVRAGLENGTVFPWHGRIAHCMMWKKAAGNWTTEEFEALKNSRFGLVLPNYLKLWWPLWGGSPEIDLSGLGFNGTVNGTTVVDGPPVGPVLIEEDIWGSMEGFAAAPPPAAGVDPFRRVPARQAARALMPQGWEI